MVALRALGLAFDHQLDARGQRLFQRLAIPRHRNRRPGAGRSPSGPAAPGGPQANAALSYGRGVVARARWISGAVKCCAGKPMKQSLRKTPSHLHLAYKYGEASDSLTGRNFML